MRNVNNRETAKSGPAVPAPWLPDATPPTDARGTKPRRDRLADIAHGKLEELIVTLELAPGSLWSEAMLSDRIGIGRTPVREAVQRLAWERLVTIIRRHGIRISDIDPHEQMLVLELRREFEPLVASRAARRATVDERRYLSKSADSFMEAGATVDVMKFLRVNFESRRFVIACARNPFVANAFAPINALTRRFYFVYQRETKDVAKAATLHAAVLKAIASGDEVAAAEAATNMVDYAEYYTRSVIVGRTPI
ncbi:MAG TPA: GntR family transcriptional regulator [Bradyrhizobium sp.]|jgi:DNA-binding GntR family transcriptional regulator|nr:GntR family transcriptional regulator [Bradyrhizobium sp.]